MMDCGDNILDAEQGQTKWVKVDLVSSKSRNLSNQWIAEKDSSCWSCRAVFQGRLPTSSSYRVCYESGERSCGTRCRTITGVLWSCHKRWNSNSVYIVSCRAASQRVPRQLKRNCQNFCIAPFIIKLRAGQLLIKSAYQIQIFCCLYNTVHSNLCYLAFYCRWDHSVYIPMVTGMKYAYI